MRIKKFTGETMKEVTDRMRTELGPDAIILNTRKVSEGRMLNFLGREMLEITAAIDDHVPVRPAADQRRPAASDFRHLLQQESAEVSAPVPAETIDGLRSIAQQFEKRAEKTVTGRGPLNGGQAEIHLLRGEMEEMRSTLAMIADHLKYQKMPALPAALQEAYMTLVQNGADERIAADLVQEIYGRMAEEQLRNRQAVEKALIGALARSIRTAPEPQSARKTTVVTLVGPTGVGKTTTIAKLAAIQKLVRRKDVGLISADTFRIGAIEQLRTFAGIADIPMEVVYKPSELTVALKKFRRKDIVFVDTVGRSQRAKKELAELKKFVDASAPDETHLVLNVASNVNVLMDAVERFAPMKPNRIIFSKVDESLMLGVILGVLRNSRLPISYVTTGQTVPDDIVPADATRIASMIYHGVPAHA